MCLDVSQMVLPDHYYCAICKSWLQVSPKRTKDHIKRLYGQRLGRQIADLRIHEMNDPVELSKLCPNLKKLELGDWLCDGWSDENNENNATITRNWKKLEAISEYRDIDIDEKRTSYSLRMLLLDAPFFMQSLTSVNMCFLNLENVTSKFIKQLKHAPVLEYLKLENAYHVRYELLDLLHENTPNLRDLELVHPVFVEEGDTFRKRLPRSVGSPASRNLRSFKVAVAFEEELELSLEEWEIKGLQWIEYICRKYPNLTSVSVSDAKVLELQTNKDIMTGYLQKAFSSWSQLEKFDMQPVHLSKKILQAMDDCHICLKEITVYVHNEEDMEQFIKLANSNQGKAIQKLTIADEAEKPWTQQHLIYFLQSLNKDDCQLTAVNILLSRKKRIAIEDPIVLSPMQILSRVPSLQSLSMPCAFTREEYIPTKNDQMTRLTHFDLVVPWPTQRSMMEYFGQQQIQDTIYSSPLLESSSIDFSCHVYGITFDFQKNTKLQRVEYSSLFRDVIKVIQNNQAKN